MVGEDLEIGELRRGELRSRTEGEGEGEEGTETVGRGG